MLTMPVIGGLLILCGIAYMARAVIFRGRLSDPHLKRDGTPTLEPRRRSLAFLGMKANWPGLLLIVIGALLLLGPALFQTPPTVDEPVETEGGETDG